MSAATIDQRPARQRRKHQLKGRWQAKPGSLLKGQIPIRTWGRLGRRDPGIRRGRPGWSRGRQRRKRAYLHADPHRERHRPARSTTACATMPETFKLSPTIPASTRHSSTSSVVFEPAGEGDRLMRGRQTGPSVQALDRTLGVAAGDPGPRSDNDPRLRARHYPSFADPTNYCLPHTITCALWGRSCWCAPSV